MKINWKKLLISLAVPLAVGALASLLSGGMSDYENLVQPPLSPPGWLFPIVWTILYLLMGYASYRIWQGSDSKKPLLLYGAQLLLNFLWPIVFFRFQWYWGSFVLLLGLWLLIYLTMQAFSNRDEVAGDLMLPYLLWVSFALYLNLATAILN